MKIEKKHQYFIIGFGFGFLITLAGMSIEDIQHSIGLIEGLNDLHHYIAPLVIGIIIAILAFRYGKQKEKQQDAMAQILDNETKNETIISNISEVIAIIDKEGIIVYKSANISRFFGWEPEELIGQPAWVTMHPDEIPRVQELFSDLVQSPNKSITLRYKYKCKNGQYKPIELTAVNLLNLHNINGVLCNYKDITQQLKNEQSIIESEYKYRTLFENSQDVINIIDNNRVIIDANSAATKLFEYSREELLNMPIDKLIYTEDKPLSNSFFEKLERKGSYNMYEGRIVTKTGKIKWIQVNASEFLKDGKKIGSLDIIRDITKGKEMELELQQTINKLHSSNATKDKLFSIIGHDLRSPFNSILGFAQLLELNFDKYDDIKKRRILQHMTVATEGALSLVENLLKWAKNQTGQIEFSPEKILLHPFIKELVKLSAYIAKVKEVIINEDGVENIKVIADRNMLKTILLNLITNAIKYVHKGGNILVSARVNADFAEIAVTDNGIGISTKVQENIFKEDENITTPGTANEEGSGLGLLLCREFVERHGGKIWVESKLNEGSRFIFTIPLGKEL